MSKRLALLLLLLCPFALPAAPAITVSGNSVTILGSAQTISLTCTLIDPNNTGNLRSGANIITTFITSTATPSNVATCGPIFGNDVITDGYGNANTTYYKVQVFTVSGGIVASTPSLQQFYAFTGSGTIDLATATPLAPSFFTGPTGNVVMPGTLNVTGATTLGNLTVSGTGTLANLNKFIYVDGVTNLLTPAGIQGAINAASSAGGGTVIIGPQGSSTIAMGSTGLVVPSNVCLVGGGPGQQTTLRWNSSIGNAITLNPGTFNACIENLTLSFPSAAAANALRISASDVSEVSFNTFKDLQINWDSAAASSAAFFISNSGPSLTNFVLNTIENVNVQFANQLLICGGCEGNHWNVKGQNIGAANSAVLVQFTGLNGDEMGDFRIDSGNGFTGITCLSISGSRNIFRVTCDMATGSTLLSDTGDYNIIDLDVVPAGTITVGTVGAHTMARITDPAHSLVYNITSSLGPSATQQHTVPAVASDTFALLAATQTFANKKESDTFRAVGLVADQGVACTNGELALSAGWQSTGSATVTAVRGLGQTCEWTITTGTTTAANPTVTDTLTNVLPNATTVCEMIITGGNRTPAAGDGFDQTTLSATAPVFTFQGTPTAGGKTYQVVRRCGP